MWRGGGGEGDVNTIRLCDTEVRSAPRRLVAHKASKQGLQSLALLYSSMSMCRNVFRFGREVPALRAFSRSIPKEGASHPLRASTTLATLASA